MSLNWYAIHSHPNKEDLLWQQILSHGFETFYPRVKVHPVNPRARKIKPYFPSYLFVRADLGSTGLSLFHWMPYATGLVSFGGEASIVPDHLITSIQQRIGEIAEAGGVLFDQLQSGDAVTIHSGPFAGYEAIFDVRLDGSERVRVLLRMLSDNTVPLELDAALIELKRKSNTEPPHSSHK